MGSASPVPATEDVLLRLLAATRLLAPVQTERSAAQAIVDSAALVFAAAGCAVFLVEGRTGILTAASGGCTTLPLGMRVSLSETPIWKSAAPERPLAVLGTDEAPQSLRDQTPAVPLPLQLSKDVVGVLWIRLREPDVGVAPAVFSIFATQAAAALENARLYASQSNRASDRELATLAHELRNPLGAIINALRVLERSGAPDAQTAELRDLIGRQARHLSRLVEDVLDVARLKHGKLRITREPVDICDIVRQAIHTLYAIGRGIDYKVRGNFAVDRLIVHGDPTRLEQVVRNLLDNAVKYSPIGTAIDVSVEKAGSEAILSVRDQGIGIEAAMLPRLFDVFAQAAPLTSKAGGGLGLGLPLVRAIVEQHGGTITAHSDGLGTGSHFTVRLPGNSGTE
jgi:signal transduction histidine kinase